MTNNEPRIDMTAARDRRIAELRAATAAYSNPIMPATISRPAPRPRRNSVRHRAIR